MAIWLEIKKAINSDFSKPLDVLIKESRVKRYKITPSATVLTTLVNSTLTIPSSSKGTTRLGIFEINATGLMRVNLTTGTRDTALIVKTNGVTVTQASIATGSHSVDVPVRQGDLVEVGLHSTHNSYDAECSSCTISGTIVENTSTNSLYVHSSRVGG